MVLITKHHLKIKLFINILEVSYLKVDFILCYILFTHLNLNYRHNFEIITNSQLLCQTSGIHSKWYTLISKFV